MGCVPKKIMYNAAQVLEHIHQASHFGITVGEVNFNWDAFKRYRDQFISHMDNKHLQHLDNLQVTVIDGYASFVSANTLQVIVRDGSRSLVTGRHITIAVGGVPNTLRFPGSEHLLNSDHFFELHQQPRKAAIIGAGYIAVELAGILNGLGTETYMFCRADRVLRNFDPDISMALTTSMIKSGVKIIAQSKSKSIVKESDGTLTFTLEDGLVSFEY